MMKWTQTQAIELCRQIEQFAPLYGCHVALTGGTLYKVGERKDIDILFYRVRQEENIDVHSLKNALAQVGIAIERDCGFVVKANWKLCAAVDLLFPDRPRADWPTDTPDEYA